MPCCGGEKLALLEQEAFRGGVEDSEVACRENLSLKDVELCSLNQKVADKERGACFDQPEASASVPSEAANILPALEIYIRNLAAEIVFIVRLGPLN